MKKQKKCPYCGGTILAEKFETASLKEELGEQEYLCLNCLKHFKLPFEKEEK